MKQIHQKVVKFNRGLLMEQFKIGHWQKAIFLFKAFGEIRSAGKAGIESYLCNIVVLFSHQLLCFMQPEIFYKRIW